MPTIVRDLRCEPAAARAIDLLEVHEAPMPRTPWLLKGWAAEGDRIVLVGTPKVGKSKTGTNLAISAALGVSWLSCIPMPRPLRVLYIDEEQTEVLARQRLKTELASRDLTTEQVAGMAGRLRYLHRNSLNLDRCLGKEGEGTLYPARALLRLEIETHRPDLLIIDSLRRLHGRDENSSQEMNAFMLEALSPIIDSYPALTVVLLAHPRKGQLSEDNLAEALRGSGDIRAFADGIWGLLRDGSQRKLVYLEGRWDDLGEPVLIELDAARGMVGSVLRDDAEGILRRLLDGTGRTGVLRAEAVETVSQDLGLVEDTAAKAIDRAVRRLYRNGELSRRRDGKTLRFWARRLAPSDAENGATVDR